MAQFTHFPRLPAGEYRSVVDDVLRGLRDMPAEGEPFKLFRGRLKRAGLWSRERLPHLLRFLRMAHTDPMVPSRFMRDLAEAPGLDEARVVAINRLWQVNPLLFKLVLERLEERVHSANEILKYIDSFAYPGNRISGPDVRAWVALAQGLGLFKPVGIRLALTTAAKPWLEKAHALDVEDFLDEDKDEPLPLAPGAPAPVAKTPAAAPTPTPAAAPSAPAAAPVPSPAPPTDGPSPLGRGEAIDPARFATHGAFDDAVLAITQQRMSAWWGEWSALHDEPSATPPPGGPTSEDWMDDAPRALFRAAVLAGLVQRRGPAGATVFGELDTAGVLDALHDGTAPDIGPAISDAGALMLASVVARRCAEHPDLASDLERCRTAGEVHSTLDGALGRGLLDDALVDLMALLAGAGGVPNDGLSAYVIRTDRGVRDTLFRLGFLTSPYTPTLADREASALAARRAVPGVLRADGVLRAFARQAGCAYGCPHRATCDLPCRERAGTG